MSEVSGEQLSTELMMTGFIIILIIIIIIGRPLTLAKPKLHATCWAMSKYEVHFVYFL